MDNRAGLFKHKSIAGLALPRPSPGRCRRNGEIARKRAIVASCMGLRFAYGVV
jgi:hypothetical protein